MAIKTFTTGEVLNAADTNTYLNNGGLVYVKSQTIGTAVSSVLVSSAFSSDYDNYRIIVTGGTASTTVQLRLQIGNATTAYYWAFGYVAYATSVFTAAAGNNTGSFENIGYNLTDRVFLQCDVYNPNAAKHTQVTANSWFYAGGASIGYGGELRDTTQHTSFTIFAGAGTMTGGTITVYGYRKA